MKAKLTLFIAATLALLLFCVVVTVNSPRSLAGEALGVDLPRPVETQWSDDHGGFLGDGVTRGVLVFSSQNGAALEKALAENEVWHTLPLPEPVDQFLYSGRFQEEECIPQVQKGYYYFRDRLHDTFSTDQLMDAYSYNATIALYDTQNTTLYLTPDFFPTPLETGEFLYFFELFLVTFSPRWGY